MEGKEQPSLSGAQSADADLGLLGNHPLSLDDKLRLTIPARFKALLQGKYGSSDAEPITMVVTISLERQYRNVAVYPVPVWRRYVQQFENRPAVDLRSQQLHRLVTSLATPVEMDGQGRIRIDKKIVEVAQLGKRVVLIGRGNSFEIWDERRFDAFVEDTLNNVDTMANTAMANMAVTR